MNDINDFKIKGGIFRILDRNWQFVYYQDKITAVWVDGHYVSRKEAEQICQVIKDKEHSDKFEDKNKIRG